MSLTVLEDRKISGLLPREITFFGAQALGLCTGLLAFAALWTGMWFLWLGVGMGAITGALLFRVTFYLRALPYEAYEEAAEVAPERD